MNEKKSFFFKEWKLSQISSIIFSEPVLTSPVMIIMKPDIKNIELFLLQHALWPFRHGRLIHFLSLATFFQITIATAGVVKRRKNMACNMQKANWKIAM